MIFVKEIKGGFDILMSQKGQVKKNSSLPGLCQSGVFSSLTRYSMDGALI